MLLVKRQVIYDNKLQVIKDGKVKNLWYKKKVEEDEWETDEKSFLQAVECNYRNMQVYSWR